VTPGLPGFVLLLKLAGKGGVEAAMVRPESKLAAWRVRL